MADKRKNSGRVTTDDKSRYIYLSGDIDEDKANSFVEKIIQLNHKSPTDPILVIIDSYGGYVDSLWSMVGAMEMSHCQVRTLCVGKAMSAAFMLLLSGAPGHRYISKHARLMMHELTSGAIGRAHQLDLQAEETRRLQKQLEVWVRDHTKMSKKFIAEKMKIDFYMDAERGIELGVVDEIIENFGNLGLKGW